MSTTYYIICLAIGFFTGYQYIHYASKSHIHREKKAYRSGLILAAMIYILFAVLWGDLYWIGIEGVGVLLFGIFAWLGKRVSFYFIALGWGIHPLWDLNLHLYGPGSHIVPAWYAIACVSFDILLATVIAYKVSFWQKNEINQ